MNIPMIEMKLLLKKSRMKELENWLNICMKTKIKRILLIIF